MIDNDFALIDVITGYQNAAVVTAAVRLGVFDVLDDGEHTLDEVAAALDVDAGNLAALLAALTHLGLVAASGEKYTASSYARERLPRGGDMSLVVEKEAVFADAWLQLDRAIATGKPTMESWSSRLETNPAQARSFLEALDVLATISGPPLHELEQLAPGKRVVDVGGGLGTYARAIQAAGSAVTLVELPAVLPWAEEVLAGSGVAVIAADVLSHDSCGVEPASMDAALVSHLLHDLPEDDGVELLRRAARALANGGALVVNDFAADSGPGAFGALFDVMMRVETPGAAHTRTTLRSMMGAAGFENIEIVPYPEPLTVLTGVKP